MPPSGFQPTSEITDRRALFGRSAEGGALTQLLAHLEQGTNTQVLGERRSGKTSVLRCLLKHLVDTGGPYVPLYVNYREHPDVIGQTNCHRFLLAHLIEAAQQHPALGGAALAPWHTSAPLGAIRLYRELCAIPDPDIGVLVSQCVETANILGQGFVVLFDEYEHLIRHTLEGREGAFFFLRDLSSRSARDLASPKPFTYAIAGMLPWDKLCNMVGSPELNNTGAVVYLGPIERAPFHEMWRQCISDSSADVQSRLVAAQLDADQVFDLAGGWPFYGKVIGSYLSAGVQDSTELYEALLQHFSVHWSRLTPDERQLIATGSAALATPSITRSLIRRGLLERLPTGDLAPCGLLWKRFVAEQYDTKAASEPSSTVASSGRLQLLVDELAELVTDINEISHHAHGRDIFQCSNQDVSTYRDLRLTAGTRDRFTHFALSVYNLVFERTTDVRPGGETRARALERLPRMFRRNQPIVRIIDSVRHYYGKAHNPLLDSFNSSGAGMPITDVLQRYLGHKTPPTDDEFEVLQWAVLSDLRTYLIDLRDSGKKSGQPTGE